MKTVTIIGYGRFGKTLHRLLQNDFRIMLFNRSPIPADELADKNVCIAKSLEEAYQSEFIFLAVPIDTFEHIVDSHKKYLRPYQLLVDVLSVKMYPAEIFEKYLKKSLTQALLTHPMFGPDSSRNGFEGLPMIMDRFTANQENYHFWKEFFQKKKLNVIEMSAKEHDKLAANSQGLTHFIGRLLETYNFQRTPIDSLGVKKLLEVKDQTCNDTWQLFTNLQHYNPYTKQMRIKLGNNYDKLYNKLLPKQRNKHFITYGIQGGVGSFNEEAVLYSVKRAGVKKYKLKYLYTSENVLHALHTGEIDRGQFAIHNSVGGIVDESIEAMARYKFKILDQFAIRVSHALMIRKDADFSKVTTIMTHPQTLRQCKQNLLQKYPTLKQTSGERELMDPSMVAKYLSQNKLPNTVAVMGSKLLADVFDLKIIEEDLQDDEENYTSFLLVARI